MANATLVHARDTASEVEDLVYVSDEAPGIRRKKTATGFRYVDEDAQPVQDSATIARIRSLAIPPAWTDVWISPLSNGHIQATGRDARNRKQYRYHARWREVRDHNKYEATIAFAEALPSIRQRVSEDMAKRGMSREKVLATVVKLLETTLIRVGNREYVKQNASFGLTTMRDRHVTVEGSDILFEFKGKSGKQHKVRLKDRRLASLVKQCQDIPGYELFQYVDDDGDRHNVTSADVNAYLREITGADFTAKDFRTWAGTVLAAIALSELETFESPTEAKRNLVNAVETVSRHLGNTPAICRKCYVHPDVIEGYMDGALAKTLRRHTETELLNNDTQLSASETAVLALLRGRLKRRRAS